jgi:hypothetical protein
MVLEKISRNCYKRKLFLLVRDKTELRKPIDAVRLLPAFRKILNKATEEDLSIEGASIDGWSILHSCLDSEDFDSVLEFLGARRAEDFDSVLEFLLRSKQAYCS